MYSDIHVFCAKMHKREVKNSQKKEKVSKKTWKKGNIGKKSLKKIVLVIRVVIKKFTKKMGKSLVE